MKKFISLLLVLTLSFSLGVTALASETEGAAAEITAAAEPEEAAPAPAAETDAAAETPALTETDDPAAEGSSPAAEPDAGPAPEADADSPGEEPILPAANDLPPEDVPVGLALDVETVNLEFQSAGASAYQEAGSFVAGQNYIIVVDGKALANNNGTITTSDTTDGSDASTIWAASKGSNGTMLTNGGVNFYYSTDKTAITTTTQTKGNWNYADGKLYYEGQGKIYVSGISGTSVTASTSDGCAVTIYTDGADLGASSGTTTETDPPADTGSGTDSGTGVQYAAADALTADMNVAFAVAGFTFGVDRGSVYVGAAAVTDGKLTVETSNWIKTVDNGAGGVALVVEDPPGETTYLSIDAAGLKSEKTSAIPGGSWAYADGKLSYTADGVTYYITGASDGAIATGADAAAAAAVALYSGTEEPQKAPPPDSSTPADDAAPIITKQPEAVPYVIEGSGYGAPSYTVEAKLPENSESRSIYFQWYVDGEKVGEELKISKDAMPDGVASSAITVDALKDKPVGVYKIHCEVWCNTKGGTEKHSVDSFTVSFLVCKGTQENSFITFSDVHETFDNVGTAIYDSMMVNEGYAPSLIICSGDWANGHLMGGEAGSDNYSATMDDYIARLRAQAAGIDMIFISGNHDNGAAAADATVEAGLGAEAGYDGLGVAYDSRVETDGSSAANTGLIVFGINYDQLAMDDGSYSYANVLPRLELFFRDLEKNYNGELVVISAHAGLHVLGLQTGSSVSSAWSGGSEYNVDMSDEVVSLLNQYGKTMDIMFFFGHDHSKSEAELFLKPGDPIVSTISYADRTFEEQTINFSYGHAGYITNTIGGQERYSQVSWDDETISRVMAVVNDNTVAELTYDIARVPKPEVVIGRLEDTAVTPELKDKGLDTAEKISGKLTLKVEALGFSAGNTALYDAKLMIKNSAGVLEEVAPDAFPAGGVTVRFPYPEGTNAGEYKFTVIHMISRGEKAGETEVLQPVLTKDGIEVTVTSLSPFAISWQLKDTAAGDTAGGGSAEKTAPPTGDESSPVLWAAVLVLCAGGAAALLPRKKRN